MAAEITTKARLDKIRNDYETNMALLQKHRYEAEQREKDRVDKIKEFRIQQMISMEKQKHAESDNKLPTSSKSKESSSETERNSDSNSEEEEITPITPLTKIVKKTVLSSSIKASDENEKTEKKDNGKHKKRKMDSTISLTPKIAKLDPNKSHADILSEVLILLDSIEKRLNDPISTDEVSEANNATSSAVNTVPSIPSQRNTLTALKLSWIPQLFTKLNAIHAEVVSNNK